MTKSIPLTQGKVALVDDEDFELLNRFKWHFGAGRYAVRNEWHGKKCITILMHREILHTSPNSHTDHINGDGSDNRRINLRECTRSENMSNRKIHINNISGYKGVSRQGNQESWQAEIQVNGIRKYLGTFSSPVEAAQAYDKAAGENHGEFARKNFPNG